MHAKYLDETFLCFCIAGMCLCAFWLWATGAAMECCFIRTAAFFGSLLGQILGAGIGLGAGATIASYALQRAIRNHPVDFSVRRAMDYA